ncbi:hypothetical protein HDU79_012032, partial [Rhizoclosmatium sp. JEL0117]
MKGFKLGSLFNKKVGNNSQNASSDKGSPTGETGGTNASVGALPQSGSVSSLDGPKAGASSGAPGNRTRVESNKTFDSADGKGGASAPKTSSKTSSRASSHSNIASPTDVKGTTEHMKEVFKKLVTYDKIIKIAPPGTEGPGPWENGYDVSPIPQRKLNLAETEAGKTAVHVMTIGRPFKNDETGEEQRRIKLYEHFITIHDIDEICKKLPTAPEEALMVVDPILRSPETPHKMTDKIMTKPAAIRSLSVAQISLLPLFGNWLNPSLCLESDVKASTTSIYLCGHCPDHGTVSRVLKPMEIGCNREQVKEHLITMLSTVLDTYWENHPTAGWAMAVVVPPGVKGDQ